VGKALMTFYTPQLAAARITALGKNYSVGKQSTTVGQNKIGNYRTTFGQNKSRGFPERLKT